MSLSRRALLLGSLLALPSATAVAALAQTPVPTPAAGRGPRRIALLIAVNGYSKDYQPLSTTPDAQAFRQVLKTRFGFTDIRLRSTRKETSRAAILADLQKLTADVRPGDIVFITYSGHGDIGQKKKDGTIHLTLVPSDARHLPGALESSNHILDTELGALLTRLKKKMATDPNSSVTLVFDCCHSGFLTAAVRGGTGAVRAGRSGEFTKKVPTRAVLRDGVVELGSQAERGFVAFLACRYDESAREIVLSERRPKQPDMGRLSYYLTQVLGTVAGKPDATYQDVYELLKHRMASEFTDQHPEIQGDRRDMLLRGVGQPAPRYFQVGTRVGEKAPILYAGLLQGMTAGSEMALYPAGTTDFQTTKPFAKATVKSVLTQTSLLAVTPAGIPSNRFQAARALETLHRFGDRIFWVDATAVGSDADLMPALRKVAQAPSAFFKLTTAGQEPADFVLRPANGGVSIVRRVSGETVREALAPDQVVGSLSNLARSWFLRTLEGAPGQNSVKDHMKLVPRDANGQEREQEKRKWVEGERFRIKVRNAGLKPAYITVLDLTPDGSVATIWPYILQQGIWKEMEQNNVIAPDNKWVTLTARGEPYDYHVTKPFGTEMLKLIALPEKIEDMHLLFDFTEAGVARGAGTRAAQTPLGSLFSSLQAGRRAGGELIPDDWSVATQTMVVVPALSP